MSVWLESPNFLVLLALAHEPMYAAQIQHQIVGDTGGTYVPDMTILNALKAMQKIGWVQSWRDGHRWAYGITDEGKRQLKIEVMTKRETVKLGRERL